MSCTQIPFLHVRSTFLLSSIVKEFVTSFLVQALEESGIRTGLVSNCDAPMREQCLPFESQLPDLHPPQGDALEDLGALRYLDPVLLSEEQGIEKPAREIWAQALKVAGMVSSHETLHVGDDLQE